MSFGCFYLYLFIGYNMPWLINAAQLEKFRKSQKNLIIFDATWHLPESTHLAKETFIDKHILGSRFLDLDMFHDKETHLPNMLLRDEKLIGQYLGELGVTNDHKIIFYDHGDLHTSCRALWMFKVFGHHPNLLYILDGGFAELEKYAGKTENGEPRIVAKSYQVNFEVQYLRTLMQMKNNLHHPSEQVIDMRHPVRFAGGTEHRLHLRAGHIPGSFSFPYFTMFEADGRFKSTDKIRKQLMSIGVGLNSRIVSCCGSGITAAILNFVLDLLNHSQHALYDGSWSEWGADTLYPGETSLKERPVITCLE